MTSWCRNWRLVCEWVAGCDVADLGWIRIMWYTLCDGPQNNLKTQRFGKQACIPSERHQRVMNARLSTHDLLKTGNTRVLPQAAALCYRLRKGRPEVLLVTTRTSRRWIIPKGWLIGGLTPAETAAQEAWEEAGVIGQCALDKVGRFSHLKRRCEQGAALCLVDVFPLHVQSVASDFPERGERKRKWCSPEKAAQKVASPELAILLCSFRPYPH